MHKRKSLISAKGRTENYRTDYLTVVNNLKGHNVAGLHTAVTLIVESNYSVEQPTGVRLQLSPETKGQKPLPFPHPPGWGGGW